MKKRFLLVVALALVAAMLVACATESTSVLDKIQKAKKVSVGTSADYPPYEYLDDAGTDHDDIIKIIHKLLHKLKICLQCNLAIILLMQ